MNTETNRKETLRPFVQAGAKWMDTDTPEWFWAIDPARLNMANGCRCVWGQVFATAAQAHCVTDGYYDSSLANGWSHKLAAMGRIPGREWLLGHGFMASIHKLGDYDLLNELWIDEVKARVNA